MLGTKGVSMGNEWILLDDVNLEGFFGTLAGAKEYVEDREIKNPHIYHLAECTDFARNKRS
jgi:hypothetical protein